MSMKKNRIFYWSRI